MLSAGHVQGDVTALRAIERGEEILLDYGDDWLSENGKFITHELQPVHLRSVEHMLDPDIERATSATKNLLQIPL
jgi:hypothetical protein